MKFVDMFCGMGTIRMGFEQAGHECVYSIEFDKWKRKIYEVIFGNEPEASDIRAVRGTDVPISDCWCFGAPCQDFSIAGLRSGMEGDRSSLVREVFRLVRETKEEYRPEWLLYENVKGMLSSNKGLDYLEILFEMGSLGYDIEWQLLNSKDFGVPQNRERVYTIGHLRRCGERKIFPIEETNCKNGAGIKILYHRKGFRRNCQTYAPDSITEALDCAQGGGRVMCVQDAHGILFTQKRITRNTNISGTLTARNPSTSRGNYTPVTGITDNNRIRFLTPREYMRLQGVPDYITDKLIAAGISDTQMYRAAGDACTVNVIYEIAKSLN